MEQTPAENERIVREALIKDIKRWVDASLFGTNPKYLHVIIEGDDERMLMVAKQMALLAHFPTFDEKKPDTFDEKKPDTRTRISILGKTSTGDAWKAGFGNLLNYDWEKLPLDVMVEHVPLTDDEEELKSRAKEWTRTAKKAFPQRFQVVYDAQKIDDLIKLEAEVFPLEIREGLAKRTNMVYEASQGLERIDAKNVNNVREYRESVKGFLNISEDKVDVAWENLLPDLKESNYCFVDSLLVRIQSLRLLKTNRRLARLLGRELYQTLEDNLAAMSQSEHSRWNVEKLMNGFRPFTDVEEVTYDKMKDAQEQRQYANDLKRNKKAHLDLCSYARLRTLDPVAVKYDSFLLLALVKYYEKNLC